MTVTVIGGLVNDTVKAARAALGPVGAFLPVSMTSAPDAGRLRDAARRFERAGYGAVWTNEVIGKDALVLAGVLLAATERIVVGTGVANIWARPAQTAHAAASELADAHPGRLVVGLGVGYPDQAAMVDREFGAPLATMRRYLTRMTEPAQMPVPDAPYARIVGANGPKMQALAGDVADGAMPAMVAPDATADARRAIGPDKLLVVLVDGSSGDPSEVAATVREHLAAGADHVTVGGRIGADFADGVDRLERLGPEPTGNGRA